MVQTEQVIDPADHINLATKIAYKFRPKHSYEKIEDTEVFSIACEELTRAAKSFHHDRGDFARFAWRSMRNGILQKIRFQNRKRRKANFSLLDDKRWNNIEQLIQDNSCIQLLPNILQDHESETAQERENKQLVIDHYIHGKQINMMASALGITRRAIHDRIKKCLASLKERATKIIGE